MEQIYKALLIETSLFNYSSKVLTKRRCRTRELDKPALNSCQTPHQPPSISSVGTIRDIATEFIGVAVEKRSVQSATEVRRLNVVHQRPAKQPPSSQPTISSLLLSFSFCLAFPANPENRNLPRTLAYKICGTSATHGGPNLLRITPLFSVVSTP